MSTPPRALPLRREEHLAGSPGETLAPAPVVPVAAPATGAVQALDPAEPAQAAAPARTRRARRLLSPSTRDVLVAVVVLLALWQLVAGVFFRHSFALSSPIEAFSQGWTDRQLLVTNTWATVQVALAGFALGNLLALVLAVLFVLSPLVDRILSQFALALYALPTLVLAPVLKVFLDPQSTRITVAALVVFFPTLISGAAGLRAASADSLDLVRSLGGNRWTALVRVRLRGALPGVFSGLRVAVPGALLGAIASEWLGADTGLGIFMVNALGYLNTARVYACVLVLVLLTVAGYALVGLGNRLVNGWQTGERDR
jgi:ABC-type nitrate/sulfonate/bicarbonate transport system permease component